MFALKLHILFFSFLTVTQTIDLNQLQTNLETINLQLHQLTQQVSAFSESIQEPEVQEESVINDDLVSLIFELAEVRVDRKVEEYRSEVEKIERVNAAFEIVLSDYFEDGMIDMIMHKLNKCRKTSNFNYMMPIYYIFKDDRVNRNLLKALSAIYRLNVKDTNYVGSSQSSDRSIVKNATNCPDCGEAAKEMVDQFASAGLDV